MVLLARPQETVMPCTSWLSMTVSTRTVRPIGFRSWELGKERNARVFYHKEATSSQIIARIKDAPVPSQAFPLSGCCAFFSLVS
jgi:hypothetical protein